mmetsp:Transcript_52308/g.161079  ORF Transcript_52308/g.161079 Transcript_52308/m.161079 type:complete len:241 (-) Transcript_52308:12-734(-)
MLWLSGHATCRNTGWRSAPGSVSCFAKKSMCTRLWSTQWRRLAMSSADSVLARIPRCTFIEGMPLRWLVEPSALASALRVPMDAATPALTGAGWRTSLFISCVRLAMNARRSSGVTDVSSSCCLDSDRARDVWGTIRADGPTSDSDGAGEKPGLLRLMVETVVPVVVADPCRGERWPDGARGERAVLADVRRGVVGSCGCLRADPGVEDCAMPPDGGRGTGAAGMGRLCGSLPSKGRFKQ